MSNQYIKVNHKHKPLVFNAILWGASFLILLLIFSKGSLPIRVDYVYTLSFLTSICIPVLINLYLLIPKFLTTEKYLSYSLLFLLNLILFSQLNTWFFKSIIDYIFPNYFFISYHSGTKLIIMFSIFLVATMLIKLAEDWVYFNRNENRVLKTQNLQIQTQLSFLRSQINPHFLFNSLNVIYALALNKKETTKDAIVQLSDILRYVIYDSNTERVTLKQEITLLKNYIAFQELRQHSVAQIRLSISVEDDNYNIYPMLILPLIENSFKHGVNADIANTFIHIDLMQKATEFNINIANNNPKETSSAKTSNQGLGLKNIKQNLSIVYPNQHHFEISNTNSTFVVTLKLTPLEN